MNKNISKKVKLIERADQQTATNTTIVVNILDKGNSFLQSSSLVYVF